MRHHPVHPFKWLTQQVDGGLQGNLYILKHRRMPYASGPTVLRD